MMRLLWPFVMGSVALGLDAYVIARTASGDRRIHGI